MKFKISPGSQAMVDCISGEFNQPLLTVDLEKHDLMQASNDKKWKGVKNSIEWNVRTRFPVKKWYLCLLISRQNNLFRYHAITLYFFPFTESKD